MELRTCEYCGTEYNASLPQCPLCGKPAAADFAADQQPARRKAKGGAREAARGTKRNSAGNVKEERIPRWMWALICVILGLAVLIGALYFFYIMGYFGKRSTATHQEETVQTSDVTPNEPEVPLEDETLDTEPPSDTGTSCTSLTLSLTEGTLDEAGGRIFLTAVAKPSDCTDEIVYSSSDETIVTVDQNGMVTAVAPGEAEILVTCGTIQKSCRIICDFEAPEEPEPDAEENPPEEQQPNEPEPPVTEPTLSSTDFTLFRPGEQTTLTVRNAPAGASISYVSSNSSVATVTDAGLVTAVGSGTATITVTVNDTKLTCIARCNLGESTENNGGTGTASGPVTISHTDVTLFTAGEKFTITLTDSNNNAVSGLSWYTSDGSVCAVDASGNVSAIGKGTATVSTTYGGQTYSCIVRCNFG